MTVRTTGLVQAEGATAGRLRRLLLAIIVLGMAGTIADLLLLEHYEDGWQAPPLVLLAAGIGLALLVALRGTPVALTAFRVVMAVCILSGAVGVALHYTAVSEFQREIDPELAGWPLVAKVMTAKAPPVLAPGVMVQLGLLGLLYTYRHPAGTRRAPGPFDGAD
jgi:hypothetical protein